MKKVYAKPVIIFESFSLSQSIASCEVKTNTPAKMQCSYGEDDFGIPIFLSGINACKSTVQDGDTVCYDVPVDNNNLFNS